tara:strand:- start:655 stop:843 length:189 start_codon:yes stop_codon:yes gene_type:complete
MYDDNFSDYEAIDSWYEEEMQWRHDHPIRAKWHDFKGWLIYDVIGPVKRFFKTGSFEEELPF